MPRTTVSERMTFEDWMYELDECVMRKAFGMSVHDLPDCCFRDWYEEDVTPVEAAKRALHDAECPGY